MKMYLGSARTIGVSHKNAGQPCQDNVCIRYLEKFNYSVSALSDGAGSVALSHIGSKTFVEMMCEILGDFLEFNQYPSKQDIEIKVIDAIEKVRSHLLQINSLDNFHATALIVITLSKKAHVFHIGDGCILIGELVEKNKILIHRSEPENGEFSNETFFFTEKNWKDHFRNLEIENPVFYLLCSDGIDPFIWDPIKGTRLDFIVPIFNKIQHIEDNTVIDNELYEIISDPRTDVVTSDDKSIIVYIDNQFALSNIDNFRFEDKVKPALISNEDLNQSIKKSLEAKYHKKKEDLHDQNFLDTKKIGGKIFLIKKTIKVFIGVILLLIFGLILMVKNPYIDEIKYKSIEFISNLFIYEKLNPREIEIKKTSNVVLEISSPLDKKEDDKANLSPENSEEIIGADQVKKIENNSLINEGSTQKKITTQNSPQGSKKENIKGSDNSASKLKNKEVTTNPEIKE